MYQFMRLVILLLAGFMLSACKEKNYTYQYLVEHPKVLEAEFNRCQALLQKSKSQEDQCKIVSNAVQMVADTITNQRHDPEKFGLRILVAQMALSDYQSKLTQAQEKLAILEKKSSSENELKKTNEEVEGLRTAYNEKQNEVKMLLSIMGMSTPE